MNAKFVFYVIQLLEGFGMGSFFPIYTPWLELHGLNFLKMGSVNFFYHISSTILDPFTGFIADKFGKRKTFVIGQIMWTATQYIYGASTQVFGFLLAEGVAAVGNSLKSDALESWLQNRLGERESSQVMGRSKILFTIGQVFSSILAGYISVTYSMQSAWFVSGTFFLIATILGSIALFRTGDDVQEHADSADVNLKQIVSLTFANKKITSAMLLLFVYSFASKPVFMFWPQIVASLNMPEILRGLSVMAMSIPALVGSLLAGHSIVFTPNKDGLYKVLIVLCIGLTIAGFAKTLGMFFVGLTILEVAYGAVRIVMYGHVYNEVQQAHRSTVNSLISAVHTLGGAVSLLIMGELADVFAPQVSLAIGGMLVLVSLAVVHLIKKNSSRSE
ncbi:MAG: MFS transporter [Patescibacteria group bacterium]